MRKKVCVQCGKKAPPMGYDRDRNPVCFDCTKRERNAVPFPVTG